MSNVIVPPHGPLDAELCWVGESPGKVEVEKGRPFIGPSGQAVRALMRQVGIDPDEVYWTNTCPVMMDPFPTGRQGAYVLDKWAARLDDELATLTKVKVVVACGGAALLRLTGRTGIGDWRGSVLRQDDIPRELVLHSSKRERVVRARPVLGPGVLVMPVLHPSGVLKDPQRAEWSLLKRDVERVERALRGALTP